MRAKAAVRALALVSLWFIPWHNALANDRQVLETFDTNGNGVIDPEEATGSFLNYFNQIILPGLAGKDPRETEEPVESAISEETAAPPEPIAPVPLEAPDEPDVLVDPATLPVVPPIEDLGTETPKPGKEKAKSKISRALLLRRTVEEVSLAQSASALDAADGAVVSYTNDVRQSTEEWQVQGSLLYPIRYETGRKVTPGDLTLSAYTFVPSVSLDRKFDSEDAASEIDSLVFRGGSEWEVSGSRWLPKQYFRFAPVYGTDFGFESSVVAAEFQYEVLKESWGLGAPSECFMKQFKCQWRAIFHLEGGKTLDAGDKTNLVEDEEFLRAGPHLNLTLQPTASLIKRLEIKASWIYLEDLANSAGATDLFETGLSWRLDDNGHLRLRAQYRHGDLPLTRDKITIVTTGLEVKF